MDEICIAVAEWAKGPATWGPSLPGEGGTGARRNARPSAHGTHRRPVSTVREAGAVEGWG
ncbi:hypothetical protein F750_3129 [Streptomyces sp. PAMC 26508]|nr:hypothetical protein F750_3129 [Streptomyces sp. PAMC 26508]